MSSTDPFSTWSSNNNIDSRDFNLNTLLSTSHRTRSVSSTQYNDQQENTRTSTDSEVSDLIPSYVDILAATNSGQDWIESYEFPSSTAIAQPHQEKRRTFQHTIIDKSPTVSVRKTRSMRDHPTTSNSSTTTSRTTSRTRLRSPPPPPPPQDNTLLNLPLQISRSGTTTTTNEKTKSLPFLNKVKRKLSFSKEKPPTELTRSSLPPPSKPRRTVSSGIIPGGEDYHHSFTTNNTLAEYQGYSRHSRHRSFTYSPPPPPRTSSLPSSHSNDQASIIPPVPPVPKQHVAASSSLQNEQTSKSNRQSTILSKKKSDTFSPSTTTTTTRNESNNGVTTCSRSNSGSYRNQPIDTAGTTTSMSVQQHSVTPITPNNADTTTTSVPAVYNLSDDLAQIEEDIKALEIQRQSFILANNQSRLQAASTEPKTATTVGRKRGKVE